MQIIKGWVSADGKTHEKVYDVKWAGDRKPGADGKLPPVGNTVDTKTATYANTIGAAELSGSFTDPGFNAKEEAFYYARVIEIPTPDLDGLRPRAVPGRPQRRGTVDATGACGHIANLVQPTLTATITTLSRA